MQLTTFQNVNIKFEHAGIGPRILACLLDLFIIACYSFVCTLVFSIISGTLLVASFIPILFYTLAFEYFLDGQTPGKKILKIRVMNDDGTQATISQYLLRWLLRIIDIFLLYGGVSIMSIMLTKQSKRLGDLLAGTIVVKVNKEMSLQELKQKEFTFEDNYIPSFPQVMQIKDKDYQIILNCFRDAQRNNDFQLMHDLQHKVENILKIESNLQPYEFLSLILKDYQYYFNKEKK